MVTRDEIRRRYRTYVDRYPKNTGMSFVSENETEYPLQDRALGGDTFAEVYRNQFANESNFLFELDNRVPSIRELPIELIPTIATELNKVLFVQVTHDHLAFWSFTDDLLNHPDTVGTEVPKHIVGLFSRVLDLSRPTTNISEIETGLSDETTASYLSYPLLEATAKWFASDHIQIDGKIKPGCEILKLGGGSYGPPEDPNEVNDCSDLGSLLFHIEMKVADSELKEQLENTRQHIGDLYRISADEVYGGVIKENRNSSLHGEAEAPAETGIALNLVSLLIWSKYV